MELESQVWCLEKEATELRESVEQQKAKNNVSVGRGGGRLPCGQGTSAGASASSPAQAISQSLCLRLPRPGWVRVGLLVVGGSSLRSQ